MLTFLNWRSAWVNERKKSILFYSYLCLTHGLFDELMQLNKGNAKECSSYCMITLISHTSKLMLKILQARLQQYVNFLMFKLVLEKAEEPEIKLPTSTGSSKKQGSSRKTSISALLTMPKPLTVWITINCGKFWNRWEYQTTWPASWEA